MSNASLALPPTTIPQREPLPWRRSIAWLLFLGPFFFLSYGFANWWTGHHTTPGVLAFDWERLIPFLPWTIVPYWSIDLLYGLSFLLCKSRREVDTHALRLLTVQLIAITCFLVFPLRFSFTRPASDGIFGWMFDLLMGFDQPFNQAPSLHIALLVVLWVRYAAASRGLMLLAVHLWAALIGISVLTTYQHHFIDLPTGVLVGLLCIWLWPDTSRPRWALTASPRRRKLGRRYLLGALTCGALALLGSWAWWLLWPTVALLLVALNYLALGPAGFHKTGGRHSTASTWLLAPYMAGAWLNSRLWTWRHPAPVQISGNVWLGRLPNYRDLNNGGFSALLDLTAELPSPAGPWITVNLPWLDLTAPDSDQLTEAATQIESLQQNGKLLVCCALGYSRSASAVCAWLLRSGRANDADAANALIAARRPQICLGVEHLIALQQLTPWTEKTHA